MSTTIDRLNAWQQLGVSVPPTASALEAMQAAQLAGWNVRKEPMFLANGQQVTGRYSHAVVRDLPNGNLLTLGQVGDHYHPTQNEEQVGLLQAITDESGAHFVSLGHIDSKRVFVTMELPDTIKVGGVDPVSLYLATFNSHDGQSSLQFMVTPVRVECANMQRAANREALQGFKVRHTLNGAGRATVEEARRMLDITFAYAEEFEREAQRMFEQEYTNQQFARLTASLFPTKDTASDAQKGKAGEHRGALMSLFTGSPTATAIRGTRWGAYQAVTEYADHMVGVRNRAGEALRENRAMKAITVNSAHNVIKGRAWELLSTAK